MAGHPGEIKKAMRLVPDDAVQRSRPRAPRRVPGKVAEYVANGATCPILYPLGDDVQLMIDTFAVR